MINCGEIYKWVDENGVVHFSDSPTDSSVFKEDSPDIITGNEGNESAQNDNEVATGENESNGEEQGAFIESASEIYQSFTEHNNSKNIKSNEEMTNDRALTDTIVQPDPETVLDDQNIQTYDNIPIETNREDYRIKRQIARRNAKIARRNAKIAAENERRRIEKKKEIEVHNAKIRAENERRRIEYERQLQEDEKRKQAVEKRNAAAKRHKQRIR